MARCAPKRHMVSSGCRSAKRFAGCIFYHTPLYRVADLLKRNIAIYANGLHARLLGGNFKGLIWRLDIFVTDESVNLRSRTKLGNALRALQLSELQS